VGSRYLFCGTKRHSTNLLTCRSIPHIFIWCQWIYIFNIYGGKSQSLHRLSISLYICQNISCLFNWCLWIYIINVYGVKSQSLYRLLSISWAVWVKSHQRLSFSDHLFYIMIRSCLIQKNVCQLVKTSGVFLLDVCGSTLLMLWRKE
jgi:hypothetical protein